MNAVRVPWSGASFLAYLGGITILGAVGSLLATQADGHGAGAFVGWALLIFVVVTALAVAARSRAHRVTAGLLALSSVAASVVLLGAALNWLGLLSHDTDSLFGGTRVSFLLLALALVAASAVALAFFRFPLLVTGLAVGSWFFVTDLLSGGGDWSAVLTILVGLGLLVTAFALDSGSSNPYAFWFHVTAGLAIGGGLLWFFHDGDWDFVLIGLAGLAYVLFGDVLTRSSWVVLGAWGILQTTAHYADKWADLSIFFPVIYLFPFVSYSFDGEGSPVSHRWAGPLAFAVAGGLFLAIALFLARRRRGSLPGAELL